MPGLRRRGGNGERRSRAHGAVERMVLLGLTGAYYTKFRGLRFMVCEVEREEVTGMTKVLHIH